MTIKEALNIMRKLDEFKPKDPRYFILFHGAKAILHHSISHSDIFINQPIKSGALEYVKEKKVLIDKFLNDNFQQR